MGRTRVEVKGLRGVQKRMAMLGRRGEDAFRGAVYAEGLHVIDKAVEKAPAATGRLRNSHWVSHPSRSGEVTIGFAVVYAAAVEYGLKLINASRRVQKAAFASMREGGWRKSNVGGPGFFRGAISETRSGRIQRVARTALRYFRRGIGFIPDPEKPRTPGQARAKSRKA